MLGFCTEEIVYLLCVRVQLLSCSTACNCFISCQDTRPICEKCFFFLLTFVCMLNKYVHIRNGLQICTHIEMVYIECCISYFYYISCTFLKKKNKQDQMPEIFPYRQQLADELLFVCYGYRKRKDQFKNTDLIEIR